MDRIRRTDARIASMKARIAVPALPLGRPPGRDPDIIRWAFMT
jgi:hypothetical protein